MKCQILFSRKNKKICFKMSPAEIFTQHAKCYVEWIHLKDYVAILQKERTFTGRKLPPLNLKLFNYGGCF